MLCSQALSDYAFRAFGYGSRALPRGEITLCEQFVLIGSGMMWNVYFAVLAVLFGFFFALLLAVMKSSERRLVRAPAAGFIFLFRGSPLFIQFFLAYSLFLLVPKDTLLGFIELRGLTRAWLGALIVLFLNTSAYTANIFYGALQAIPRGDIEAAKAYGLSAPKRFRRIILPTLMRLAWPSYTNEAIFLFHATALVFFTGFPAWQQRGDALYYANYFAERTFNPFVAYPIAAGYFVLATVIIIFLYGQVNKRLNRHLRPEARSKVRYRPQLIR